MSPLVRWRYRFWHRHEENDRPLRCRRDLQNYLLVQLISTRLMMNLVVWKIFEGRLERLFSVARVERRLLHVGSLTGFSQGFVPSISNSFQ